MGCKFSEWCRASSFISIQEDESGQNDTWYLDLVQATTCAGEGRCLTS